MTNLLEKILERTKGPGLVDEALQVVRGKIHKAVPTYAGNESAAQAHNARTVEGQINYAQSLRQEAEKLEIRDNQLINPE